MGESRLQHLPCPRTIPPKDAGQSYLGATSSHLHIGLVPVWSSVTGGGGGLISTAMGSPAPVSAVDFCRCYLANTILYSPPGSPSGRVTRRPDQVGYILSMVD